MKAKTDYKDHRKRSRNRTTQSCLNCHSSKRLCDRKRPSCGRCVKMGLSGTCTYEVDDPRQWDGCEDTTAHLRRRITELELFIRTCKQRSPLNSRSIRRASLPPPELSRESVGVEGSSCDMPSPLSDSVLDQVATSVVSCDSNDSASFDFLSSNSEELFRQNMVGIGDEDVSWRDISSSSSSINGLQNDLHLLDPNVFSLPEYYDGTSRNTSITPLSTSGVTTPFSSITISQGSKHHCIRNDDIYPLDDILADILQSRTGCNNVNIPAPACACHRNTLIPEIMADLCIKVKKTHDALTLFPEHYYHQYTSTSKQGCEYITAINDTLSILSRTLNTGYRYTNDIAKGPDLSRYNGIDLNGPVIVNGPSTSSTPGSWLSPSPSESPMDRSIGLRAESESSLTRSSSRLWSQVSQPRTWDQRFSGIAQHAPSSDGGLMSWNGSSLNWP